MGGDVHQGLCGGHDDQGGTGSGTSGPYVRKIWERLYGVTGDEVKRDRAIIPGVLRGAFADLHPRRFHLAADRPKGCIMTVLPHSRAASNRLPQTQFTSRVAVQALDKWLIAARC
ncbi:MAG: hypothetical protein R2693_10185 [Nocardioidaceae bacterium]